MKPCLLVLNVKLGELFCLTLINKHILHAMKLYRIYDLTIETRSSLLRDQLWKTNNFACRFVFICYMFSVFYALKHIDLGGLVKIVSLVNLHPIAEPWNHYYLMSFISFGGINS